MDYNVVVLAMSIFPFGSIKSKRITRYRLKKDGKLGDETYEGVGQMEVVPIMLSKMLAREKRKNPQAGITHMLILETSKTTQPIDFQEVVGKGERPETYEVFRKVLVLPPAHRPQATLLPLQQHNGARSARNRL